VAGAPPATVYHQCSPDQWDAWYTLVTGLGDGAEPFELLVTLAQELRNEGVPFAEKWGESPNALDIHSAISGGAPCRGNLISWEPVQP
jgi:hypothetical protein